MGLTPDPADGAPDDPGSADPAAARAALLDEIAAFALDAVDLQEAVTIEARLATDPEAARIERRFRATAGAVAAAHREDARDHAAAQALRARVLDAAHRRGAPMAVVPASAIEVHRIEVERLLALLRGLSAEQWALPVDPPELAGWTVKDVAAHVAANEGYTVQVLGLAHPVLPETADDDEARTAEVLARHRSLSPAETIAELEACARAVDDRVTALDAESIQAPIEWWDSEMPIATVLVVRSFETWTHADDIRRAIGAAPLPPPAPSLSRMSRVAAGLAPHMLRARGEQLASAAVELHLTGPGGGTLVVPLGDAALDPAAHRPGAVITADVVDYCRVIGKRLDPADLPYEAAGDLDLAQRYVRSLDALARL